MPVVGEEFQEQVLSVVRKGNTIALDAIKTAATAETVAKLIPVINSIPVPKLPASVGTHIPPASDVVDSAFFFAQRLLDEERIFAREAVKAASAFSLVSAEKPAIAEKAGSGRKHHGGGDKKLAAAEKDAKDAKDGKGERHGLFGK